MDEVSTDATESEEGPVRGTRPGWRNPAVVWGGVLGVLVIGSVILALTADRTVAYPETTPEGVVQRYVAAVLENDIDVALSYYTPELAERCDPVTDRIRPYEDVAAVDLVDTKTGDDDATVTIEVTVVYSDPPFDLDRYRYREDLHLARTDDGWRIDRIGWPWFGCPEPPPEG